MKTMKKLLSLCLAVCLVLSVATPVFAADETPFADLTSNWYKEAVAYVYENELMNGTGDTTFAPKGTVNRAMVVTVLHRAADLPAAKDDASVFTDIVAGKYYYNAVLWAEDYGVTTGTTATTFEPNKAVTREEVATFLHRYAGIMGYDTSASAELEFPDKDKVHNYAKEAMAWAVGAGVINGNADGTLNPRGEATRAELAVMLMRFCENVAVEEEEPTEPSENPTEPSEEPTEPSENPDEPIFINPEEENIADLSKGETQKYQGRLFGMIMTISQAQNATVTYKGKEYKADENGMIIIEFPVSTNMTALVEFSITSSADGKYEMSFEYPAGDMMNPAQLDVGQPGYPLDNEAEIEKGDLDGYFYTWTAEEAGVLTLSVSSTNGWSYKVNNMTAAQYGDTYTSADDEPVSTFEIAVEAGEEFQINVTTFDAKDIYTAPAGTVTVSAEFKPVPGTENNPYVIKVPAENPYATEKLAKDSTTYFVAQEHERQIMTIANASNLVVKFGGKEYKPENGIITVPLNTNQPAAFQIVNNGAEAAYEIAFSYDEGTENNPIDLGSEETFVAEVNYTLQDEHGIYYVWTAPADGILNTAVAAPEDSTANIIVEINGKEVESAPVLKGDEVQIFVSATNAYGLPAVVDFEISGEMSGTQNNPIAAEVVYDDEYMPCGTTLAVPAGATYYYTVQANVDGMNMVIENAEDLVVTYNDEELKPVDGTLTVNGLVANMWMQVYSVFAVSNNADADVECEAVFEFPLGSDYNPEKIEELGTVNASVEADNYMGYKYVWTATDDGVLYITVTSEDNCDVTVNAGSEYKSLSENGVDGKVGILVSEGDEVFITFNSMPNAQWEYEAAEAELKLELSNETVEAEVAGVYYASFEEAVAAAKASGETVKLIADIDSDERVLTVENGETVTVNMNGHEITSSYDPYTISVEKGGELTIIGEGLIENTSAGSTVIRNYGKLTIGGEWASAPEITRGETTNGAGNSAVKCEEESELIIWGGIFGGDQRSIQSWGTTTIYGGTFEKAVEVWQWDDSANTKVYESEMTVYGGTFEGTLTVRADENDETDDEGTLTIYGGVISDSTALTYVPYEDYGYSYDFDTEMYTVAKKGSSAEVPIVINSDADFPVSVKGWEPLYFRTRVGGMTLVIEDAGSLSVCMGDNYYSADDDGKIEVELPALMGMGQFNEFFLDAYSDMDVVLKFVGPLGSMTNPDAMIMGENNAQITEGSQGYFYKWTATEDGTLTITMAEGMTAPWTVQITNYATSYQDGVMNSQYDDRTAFEIPVSAGDEIEVMVCTLGEGFFAPAPAGTVSFTAAIG